jgi:hypothetical protein
VSGTDFIITKPFCYQLRKRFLTPFRLHAQEYAQEAGMGVEQFVAPSLSQIRRHAFKRTVATAIMGAACALLIGCATTDPSPKATETQASESDCRITGDYRVQGACTTMEILKEAMDKGEVPITVEKGVIQSPDDSNEKIKIIEEEPSRKLSPKE